jgi:hypothetical protein
MPTKQEIIDALTAIKATNDSVSQNLATQIATLAALVCNEEPPPTPPEDEDTLFSVEFSGNDEATIATDLSIYARPLAFLDNAHILNNKLLLDGANDCVKIPWSADFQRGAGDFTIDAKASTTSLSEARSILTQWQTGGDNNRAFSLRISNGKLAMSVNSGGINFIELLGATTLQIGIDYDISFERFGSLATLFLNGVVDAQAQISGAMNNSPRSLLIGGQWGNAVETPGNINEELIGTITKVRFIKKAVYQGENFIPSL